MPLPGLVYVTSFGHIHGTSETCIVSQLVLLYFIQTFDVYVTKILHIHFPYLCVKTEIFKLDKNQTF
jgi:hypothetical protein